jgi:hypothetical protein
MEEENCTSEIADGRKGHVEELRKLFTRYDLQASARLGRPDQHNFNSPLLMDCMSLGISHI